MNLKFKIEFEKYGIVHNAEVELNEYVAHRFQAIKIEKKLTLREIAQKGGLPNEPVVSRALNGKHQMGIETFYKMCLGLNCKPSDILPF